MAAVRTLREFLDAPAGSPVAVGGWVEEVRNLGSIGFAILRLRDGTVQVTAKKKVDEGLFRKIMEASRESVVRVEGALMENKEARHGREVHPTRVDVLSAAATPLPLGIVDRVGAEFDTRLDNRILDARKPAVQAVFRVRSLLERALRRELDDLGFVEVHTPKLSGAGAEGGSTLFETDYFGRKAFLSQSPQLYKQMLMGTGFDRVYEIAPAFRAEPSDTVRHVTEFTSFDGEVAWIEGPEDFLTILEGVLARGIAATLREGKEHLEALGAHPKVPPTPLPRVTYAEALGVLREHGKRVRDGDDLDTDGEKVLGRAMADRGHEMYFVTDYPAAIKPFYVMAKPDEPETSLSFDLEYKGDEMASGGQREHRIDPLVAKIREKGLDPKSFEFYLSPFRYGMPPHGGWGLGIDRLVQKLLDLPNVREAILFPRDRNRLVP